MKKCSIIHALKNNLNPTAKLLPASNESIPYKINAFHTATDAFVFNFNPLPGPG